MLGGTQCCGQPCVEVNTDEKLEIRQLDFERSQTAVFKIKCRSVGCNTWFTESDHCNSSVALALRDRRKLGESHVGVRVHTLAKELNRSSKELMEILSRQGIHVKNHFSSVDETTAAKLRIQFGGEDSIREPKAKKSPAKKSKTAVATVEKEETVEASPDETDTSESETEKPVRAASKAKRSKTEKAAAPSSKAPPSAEAESAAKEEEPKEEAPQAEATTEAAPASPTQSDSEPEATETVPPAKQESAKKPDSEQTKIEMAPGFGNSPTRPAQPVTPVARPMPAGGPQHRQRKARPLIIRSKPSAPTAPPQKSPADRGPGGRGPGRGGGPGAPGRGGPGRGPGGPGRGPGGPGRGPGGPGRGPGGGGRGGPPPGGGGPGGSPGSKVRFFPGEGGIPPGPGGPDGKGRRGGGRRSGKTHRGSGGGGRGRQRETFEYFRRQREEEVLSGERPSEIKVQLPITPKELSPMLAVKVNYVLKALLEEQVLVNANTSLTEEMLLLIGEKFSILIEVEEAQTIDSSLDEIESKGDPEEALLPRAPVVTILGHVDHGKTSLLDKIRETRVTQSESGGITQHISAYRVDHEDKHVVFIDTPGHKAFTEMRARGANITDVAVLVVAADDGPMPQTEEAMQHAQAANVPIVVALNKIDRPNANPNRAKQKLAEIGIAPPDWGGNTELVEVSALQGTGIDSLLELLSLETEILDLKANPDKNAIGTVLEARATTGRGNVITVLIQEGTLKAGDIVITGPAYGKIRTMSSTVGFPLTEAGPSTPVEITGLNDLPEAGDRFYVLDDLAQAREIAEDRQRRKRAAERMERTHVTLEKLFDHISQGKTKEIKLVVKTDVQGSLEVLRKELTDLSTEEVGIRIIRGGVGAVTEDDVLLADASDAIIIGFHVTANLRARAQADEKGVDIRTYQVIYQAIEQMKLALEGLLAPEVSEETQGSAEILQLFRSSKLGNIAGCIVRNGVIRREDPVRLIREGRVIYEGKLDSLKRIKEDAKEVKEGFECGLRIQGYGDIKVGDMVESFRKVEKARTLDDVSGGS